MSDDIDAELDRELALEELAKDWGQCEAERNDLWALEEYCTLQEFRDLENEALIDEAEIFDRKLGYREYLKTRVWKIRAAQVKRWGMCMRCGQRTSRLDAHHKTYERLGNERPSDLVALCRACHQAVHGK